MIEEKFKDSNKKPIISKTIFLQGIRCDRLFHWQINHNFPENEIQNPPKFYRNPKQNDEIFKLARLLFPKGIEIPTNLKIEDSIKETTKYILERNTIFNAGILSDNYYCRIDILEPTDENKWNLIEIRPNANPKQENWLDMCFQKFVLEKSNIYINDFSLILINSNYHFKNNLEINNLFINKNVNHQIDKHYSNMKIYLDYLESTLTKGLPERNQHSCKFPKDCKYPDLCWDNNKDSNIFQLREGSYLAKELYNSGIRNLKNIPDSTELSNSQKIQIQCDRDNNTYINTIDLEKFLSQIKYPIYFLDFETINPPIPVYENSKPFQHIPFLYSLHIQKETGEIEHYYDFEKEGIDPRQSLMESLKNKISDTGSIICFNDMFEKKIINESTQYDENFKDWASKLWGRFLDLSLPFKNFSYYNPDQKGSASLKAILKPLTGLDYSLLKIKDGSIANSEYLIIKLNNEKNSEKFLEIKNHLIDYCKMDTFAMIEILKKLRELINQK
jgi:hypothetical protein